MEMVRKEVQGGQAPVFDKRGKNDNEQSCRVARGAKVPRNLALRPAHRDTTTP
jgi:hypothetical protein